jgi:hypothetical protein
LSAPFLTVPLLKVPLLRLPLSEASPFSALSIGLPSDFGDLCVDDLVFLTMYDGRFAIAMHAAKPAAKIIRLSELFPTDLVVLTDLHWAVTTPTRRTRFGDDDVCHDDFSSDSSAGSGSARSASITKDPSVFAAGRSEVLCLRCASAQAMRSARA